MTGQVRFVEEPATVPVVILDINQPMDGMYVRSDGFDLGAPEWQTEPGAVGGDDGYREMTLTVAVDQSYTNAAAHMSSLARVLQRTDGWLMIRRDDEHNPFFLRWYRTAPQPMNWELWHIDTYTLQLTLTCDPYLYGEPILLGPFDVRNNPLAAVDHPAMIRLDDIVGDAPAPLKVDIVPDGDWHGYQPLMSSAALAPGQDMTDPIVWDSAAAGFISGDNTGANVVNSAYVGGSYRQFTPTGTLMQTRMSGSPPAAPIPGTYKVMLRVVMTADQSTFAIRLGQVYNVTEVRFGPTVKVVRPDTTLTTWATWVDLGDFTFPFGAAGLTESDIGAATVPEIQLQAQRVSGLADLRLDAMVLIPTDTAATLDAVVQTSRFHGWGLEADRSGVWDGLKGRFLSYDFGVALANLRPPLIKGGWLHVTPGVVNIVHLLQQTLTATPALTTLDDDDEIANDATVKLTYLPRYLHLRPDVE